MSSIWSLVYGEKASIARTPAFTSFVKHMASLATSNGLPSLAWNYPCTTVSINQPCNWLWAPQLASLEKLATKLGTSRVCKKGEVFLLDTHFLMSWF
jgi:hypothetical protein